MWKWTSQSVVNFHITSNVQQKEKAAFAVISNFDHLFRPVHILLCIDLRRVSYIQQWMLAIRIRKQSVFILFLNPTWPPRKRSRSLHARKWPAKIFFLISKHKKLLPFFFIILLLTWIAIKNYHESRGYWFWIWIFFNNEISNNIDSFWHLTKTNFFDGFYFWQLQWTKYRFYGPRPLDRVMSHY